MDSWTNDARMVMQLANQEAQKLNHEYIGTEHLLLGIAKKQFQHYFPENIRVDAVVDEVMKLVTSGPQIVTLGKLPQTPRAKRVIEMATERAGDSQVSPVCILDAMYLEGDNVGFHVLKNLGYPKPQEYPAREKKGKFLFATKPPSISQRLAYLEQRIQDIERRLG